MRSLSPVIWSEGMHLSPHHFQAQARYFEDLQLFATRALFGNAWGLSALRMDEDALRNGSVELAEARGILPDGLVFRIPGDEPPPALPLDDVFPPTASARRVFLELPAHRASGPNSSPPEGAREEEASGHRRYRPLLREVRDQVTGDRDQAIALACKNFRLSIETSDEGESSEEASAWVRIPLARIRRDGSGRFEYDPTYVPPTLQVGGSPALVALLERVTQVLEERARSLADQRRGLAGGAGGASELTGFWFSHAVNAHLPVLRHHLSERRMHPARLHRDLATLAGALSTFSLTARATDLPSYDHSDPGPGFRDLETAIRRGLETVVGSSVLRLPIRMGDGYFHGARVTDPRALEGSMHWYLGVRSSSPRSAVLEGVPRLAKLCSARHIERLVREAYPGLTLEHAPTLPRGLPAAPGTEYFRIRRTEPCWTSIEDTQEVGIYIPESVADPELELVVLPDPEQS